MPTEILANLPDGAPVFVDANVFIYGLSSKSPECNDLLERCTHRELQAVTSFAIINEVTHRLMLFEAYESGLISKPRADVLQNRPSVIQSLSQYWDRATQIFNMNLAVINVSEAALHRAHSVRLAHGLLTLDSVTVALMQEYGITRIATHDADFARIGTLTVYRPTDIP